MNKTIKIIKSIGAAVMSLVLISMCVLTAFAADSYVTLYGFVFEDNSSGEAVICDYDDRESYVVIPESLLDKPVTKIADYAFYSDTVITNINFEKAVSLHQIGDNAFSKCSGLSSVTIPDNVALGFGAFQRCEGLKSAFMGNTITVIPEQCFYFCPSLEKVYLPDTVTVIEPRAFDGCDNLVIYTPKNSYTYHYAIENDIPVIPTDIEWLLGDSNGDGYVNINDVTRIRRSIGKSISCDALWHPKTMKYPSTNYKHSQERLPMTLSHSLKPKKDKKNTKNGYSRKRTLRRLHKKTRQGAINSLP